MEQLHLRLKPHVILDREIRVTRRKDAGVAKYMEPAGLTHGIYIVYWAAPELRPKPWHKKHPDAGALTDELREQAAQRLPRRHVDVVVLDIGPS